MFPLKFSPDEPTGAATAEAPEAAGAEALIPDKPDEGKPEPDTEREPGTEKPESVAGEAEGGDEVDGDKVRAEFIESIGAIKDADPDLYKELFPEEQERQPSEDRETEIALRESRVARQEERQKSQTGLEQRYGQALSNVAPAFQEFQKEITAQNQRVKDGQAEAVSPNFTTLAQAVDTVRQESASVGFSMASAAIDDAIQDTLEAHPTHRYLDASDRQRIADAKPEDRMAVRIQAQLDAALARGAPAETKAQAKKDAEATVGMTERLEKVKTFLSANGATKKVEAGGSTDHSNDNDLLANPNTPIEKVMEIRNRQRGG